MTNIETVPAHCVGEALKAVYLQANLSSHDLLLEMAATPAHSPVFTSGQRD